MEKQIILSCVWSIGGPYFSKWLKGQRRIGNTNPYYALQEECRADRARFGSDGDITLLLQPLIKWSEE